MTQIRVRVRVWIGIGIGIGPALREQRRVLTKDSAEILGELDKIGARVDPIVQVRD